MKHKPLLALALFAAILALGSCKTSLRYASVHIAEVLPAGGLKTLYIAVSPNYWFKDSFITNAIAIPPGGPYTDIFIDNIAWDTDDKDDSSTSRDFWLLVAEDMVENGEIGPGDRYIPFAHITLTDGETLEITTVDFTNPISYNLDQQQHIISILHSNPAAIDKSHKVTMYYFDTIGHYCTFSDPLLCREIIFWNNNALTDRYFFWDEDGDGGLTPGDYRTQNESSNFPDRSTFILSPFMVQ